MSRRLVGGRRLAVRVLGGAVCGAGLVGAVAYTKADSSQRRRLKISVQGIVRFCRSAYVGLTISVDYWWAGWGLDQVRRYGRGIHRW